MKGCPPAARRKTTTSSRRASYSKRSGRSRTLNQSLLLRKSVSDFTQDALTCSLAADQLRRKATLEEQVRQFSTREASTCAQKELSRTSTDNVRVIERANEPTRGRRLRNYVGLGAIVFDAFTAFLAGLVKALSRTGFATPPRLGGLWDCQSSR